jgi:hypothetical protein
MFKVAVFVVALMFVSPVLSDSLRDSSRLLCVPGQVSHCVVNGDCRSELPEDENIPEFIEVDFKQKTLASTRASGENRSTQLQNISREAGYIYLNGVENGRSFSIVISESTGDLTFVVATDGETAAMFGNCTPD